MPADALLQPRRRRQRPLLRRQGLHRRRERLVLQARPVPHRALGQAPHPGGRGEAPAARHERRTGGSTGATSCSRRRRCSSARRSSSARAPGTSTACARATSRRLGLPHRLGPRRHAGPDGRPEAPRDRREAVHQGSRRRPAARPVAAARGRRPSGSCRPATASSRSGRAACSARSRSTTARTATAPARRSAPSSPSTATSTSSRRTRSRRRGSRARTSRSACATPVVVAKIWMGGGITTPAFVGDRLVVAGYDEIVHLYSVTYDEAAEGDDGALPSADGRWWTVSVRETASLHRRRRLRGDAGRLGRARLHRLARRQPVLPRRGLRRRRAPRPPPPPRVSSAHAARRQDAGASAWRRPRPLRPPLVLFMLLAAPPRPAAAKVPAFRPGRRASSSTPTWDSPSSSATPRRTRATCPPSTVSTGPTSGAAPRRQLHRLRAHARRGGLGAARLSARDPRRLPGLRGHGPRAAAARETAIVFDRQDRAYSPLTIRLRDGSTPQRPPRLAGPLPDLVRRPLARGAVRRARPGPGTTSSTGRRSSPSGRGRPSRRAPRPAPLPLGDAAGHRRRRGHRAGTHARHERVPGPQPGLGRLVVRRHGRRDDLLRLAGGHARRRRRRAGDGRRLRPRDRHGRVHRSSSPACRPDDDPHVQPGICVDGRGYLHVVTGAHGGPFLYTRSAVPLRVDAGWTAPEPTLDDGYYIPSADLSEGRQTLPLVRVRRGRRPPHRLSAVAPAVRPLSPARGLRGAVAPAQAVGTAVEPRACRRRRRRPRLLHLLPEARHGPRRSSLPLARATPAATSSRTPTTALPATGSSPTRRSSRASTAADAARLRRQRRRRGASPPPPTSPPAIDRPGGVVRRPTGRLARLATVVTVACWASALLASAGPAAALVSTGDGSLALAEPPALRATTSPLSRSPTRREAGRSATTGRSCARVTAGVPGPGSDRRRDAAVRASLAARAASSAWAVGDDGDDPQDPRRRQDLAPPGLGDEPHAARGRRRLGTARLGGRRERHGEEHVRRRRALVSAAGDDGAEPVRRRLRRRATRPDRRRLRPGHRLDRERGSDLARALQTSYGGESLRDVQCRDRQHGWVGRSQGDAPADDERRPHVGAPPERRPGGPHRGAHDRRRRQRMRRRARRHRS